ncbi:hypothetical protein [Streptomyces longisporus]|uniref:Uncharacterized protein n=1 Tax=Streptomyces longisporus TaxID=1948 RepID=A0ABP5Z695_STRLO
MPGIEYGATVLVGGFGKAEMPVELIDALIRAGRERADGGVPRCARQGPGAQDRVRRRARWSAMKTGHRKAARGRPSKGGASGLLYALLRGRGAPRLAP